MISSPCAIPCPFSFNMCFGNGIVMEKIETVSDNNGVKSWHFPFSVQKMFSNRLIVYYLMYETCGWFSNGWEQALRALILYSLQKLEKSKYSINSNMEYKCGLPKFLLHKKTRIRNIKTRIRNTFWANFPKNMLFFFINMAFFPFFDDFGQQFYQQSCLLLNLINKISNFN